MRIYHRFFLFSLLILGVSFNSFADGECSISLPPCLGAPGEIPAPDPDATCCDEIEVPLDGGVSLMIAGGIGMAAFKMRRKKK